MKNFLKNLLGAQSSSNNPKPTETPPNNPIFTFRYLNNDYELNEKWINIFSHFILLSTHNKMPKRDWYKALGPLIEEDETFPEELTLEVSSPGINRALRKTKDFLRFSGSPVLVHSIKPLMKEDLGLPPKEGDRGQKKFKGVLQGVDVESNNIQLTLETQELVNIPMDAVSKANLDMDFSALTSR